MKNLTRSQVANICKAHKYILLRARAGWVMGVNCKVVDIGKNKTRINEDPNKQSVFISFKPCEFDEYIYHKQPFIV